MKRILGLDLGTTSIGWAFVEEGENEEERSSIISVGSRVIPLTAVENTYFKKGKAITTNADRTLNRSKRRNLQRYKLRRENLKRIMLEAGWISEDTILAEHGNNKTFETLKLRGKAAEEKITLEELARVYLMICKKRGYKSNRKIDFIEEKNKSTYLDKIDDRHKELYLNNMTVGQYLVSKLEEDPNVSLKNNVFYRQDYIDEFDRIWAKQAEFHPELTDELKKELKDNTIFYQRPLRSQKGLVSICEFESHEINKDGKVKTVGLKVCPKSSPLYQEFKIWQKVNNVTIKKKPLEQEQKELLFSELNTKQKMSEAEVRELFGYKDKDKINYDSFEGNRTNRAFFEAYIKIIEDCGYDRYDLTKEKSARAYEIIEEIFRFMGYKTDFLHFDACLEGDKYQSQPAYKLWHLIYSYEGDKSATGVEGLISKIREITGFSREHAQILANITFKPDYGSLSSKAIRKIMPYLREGYKYSEACELAGYRHSKSSQTKEELYNKVLKDHLDLLPKNSLRNPVVEKILNQMVNVVNLIIKNIVKKYGKIDEIHIELARDLKKSAKQRKKIDDNRIKSEVLNKKCIKDLDEIGIKNPSYNDILKCKLFRELEYIEEGKDKKTENKVYRTLYSNTPITLEQVIKGKDIEKEHIIPKSRLFDDSFSNLTLETRIDNHKKDNSTAYDYVRTFKTEEDFQKYLKRVDQIFQKRLISKTKRKYLLMTEADIPDDFINRDLSETQYIVRKAKFMLETIAPILICTTGAITKRLREDWQLIDVMKELNKEKIDKLKSLEEDGERKKNWTKRGDHRHHAMDAIIIAFTRPEYIEYLNYLNARFFVKGDNGENVEKNQESISKKIKSIENKYLMRDNKGKMGFIPPMPIGEFRAETKKHLANCLVSIKAKNKVVTKNVNNNKVQLTPRGQLHDATFYGKIDRYETKEERVGSAFTASKISEVANKSYREALSRRLKEFGDDPKKAFTGKNSLEKNPLFLDEAHLCQVPAKVKTMRLNSMYTIRKPVNKDLKVDKVVDEGIKRILQARLEKYDNNPGKAFSNLEQDPIWLNKEKGIQIKRVKVFEAKNPIPLYKKTDFAGNIILDKNKLPIDTGYVRPDSNHHIAIYRNEKGDLEECVVSFYNAVKRAIQGKPIIDKDYNKDKGWEFLFTMKQNEYFVFPDEKTNFDPNDIDLLDSRNYEIISPNLYRVQKFTTKDYFFRHHLETTVDMVNELKNTTWKRISNVNDLRNIVKVRLNHLGQIVSVGEDNV